MAALEKELDAWDAEEGCCTTGDVGIKPPEATTKPLTKSITERKATNSASSSSTSWNDEEKWPDCELDDEEELDGEFAEEEVDGVGDCARVFGDDD